MRRKNKPKYLREMYEGTSWENIIQVNSVDRKSEAG